MPSLDLSSLPQVRLPYRMWRAPALDFVVSGGVTYRASTGTKIDRRAAVYAAGEVAQLSYNAQVTRPTTRASRSRSALRAFRSDPDGGLLGPLDATHFEFGDVAGHNSRLLGSGANGRGVAVTNQPLFTPASFDRTRFEGELPVGWEAEIYRNGQLLGFAETSGDQRYHFDDVQLLYGENRIDIVLYGPQGQVRTRSETVNVGQENVPAGQDLVLGRGQPARPRPGQFLSRSPTIPTCPQAQATVAVAHGIDQKTSVGVTRPGAPAGRRAADLCRRHGAPLDRRAPWSKSRWRATTRAGMAARAQMLTRFGGGQPQRRGDRRQGFPHRAGSSARASAKARVSLDAPLKIGRALVPVHGDVRYSERGDGTRQLEAAARLSSHINRFNLAGDLRYRRQWSAGEAGPDPPPEIEGSLIASGRIGAVRLRGSGIWQISPASALQGRRSCRLIGRRRENADFEGAVAYDAQSQAGARAG